MRLQRVGDGEPRRLERGVDVGLGEDVHLLERELGGDP